jgi:hypothetical protein
LRFSASLHASSIFWNCITAVPSVVATAGTAGVEGSAAGWGAAGSALGVWAKTAQQERKSAETAAEIRIIDLEAPTFDEGSAIEIIARLTAGAALRGAERHTAARE